MKNLVSVQQQNQVTSMESIMVNWAEGSAGILPEHFAKE